MICRALALVASKNKLDPLASATQRTSVERESGVNLGGDTARDDLEDLGTEADKESVHGVLSLLLEVTEV